MSETKTTNPIVRAWRFYLNGFRGLTPMSKTLWVIIVIKLFVMFAVLRPFFFPNYNKQEARRKHISTSEQVQNELIERGKTDSLK